MPDPSKDQRVKKIHHQVLPSIHSISILRSSRQPALRRNPQGQRSNRRRKNSSRNCLMKEKVGGTGHGRHLKRVGERSENTPWDESDTTSSVFFSPVEHEEDGQNAGEDGDRQDSILQPNSVNGVVYRLNRSERGRVKGRTQGDGRRRGELQEGGAVSCCR